MFQPILKQIINPGDSLIILSTEMDWKKIVVGVACFEGNPHDSKTLEKTLEHIKKITGKVFNEAITDRGYRGIKAIGDTKIITPEMANTRTTTSAIKEGNNVGQELLLSLSSAI